jgi:hypothetical protein
MKRIAMTIVLMATLLVACDTQEPQSAATPAATEAVPATKPAPEPTVEEPAEPTEAPTQAPTAVPPTEEPTEEPAVETPQDSLPADLVTQLDAFLGSQVYSQSGNPEGAAPGLVLLVDTPDGTYLNAVGLSSLEDGLTTSWKSAATVNHSPLPCSCSCKKKAYSR